MVQAHRAEGPTLVLDGGDALFPRRGERDPARAKLILDAMAATGVAAAAVGELDLAMGAEWLIREAKASGVPFLSANLVGPDGDAPFEGRKIVEIANNRVGIYSVVEDGARLPEGWTATDPAAAAAREAAALRSEGADLVIALVHGRTALVNAIARSGEAELVLPAHGGATTFPYLMGKGWVAYAGSEGKKLLRLRMDLRGEGGLVSLSHLQQLAATRAELEGQLAKAEAARGEAGEKERLQRRLTQLAEDEKTIGSREGARTFSVDSVVLSASVGEDPSFLEEVQKLERLENQKRIERWERDVGGAGR